MLTGSVINYIKISIIFITDPIYSIRITIITNYYL
nr:MAG TPA: hypothetical protein [Caudoviricetes sp.]